MCTAIKEMIADGKAEGILQGKVQGAAEEKAAIIANMLNYGISDKDIQVLANCGQEVIDSVKELRR